MSDERPGPRPTADGDRPARGIEGLTDDVLPALIARLRASGLAEIEVARDGWRVRLRRDVSPARPGPEATGATAESSSTTERRTDGVARSPAVGYFSPGPELVVGRSVQGGDTLGSVDVLGIAQDVVAPSDGIVTRVLAEAGQAVEYGQALADIEVLAPEPPAPTIGSDDDSAVTEP